jgi:hypothetical protein
MKAFMIIKSRVRALKVRDSIFPYGTGFFRSSASFIARDVVDEYI